MRNLTTTSCVAAGVLMMTSSAAAQSFGLDDNPRFPATGFPGFGYGAEDPFGLPKPGFPPGLAPSPTLFMLPCFDGDVLGPAPYLMLPRPFGDYNDSLSGTTPDPDEIRVFRIRFSVDRLALGAPGTALAAQRLLNQHPADIYETTVWFRSPARFVGRPGPVPYGGQVPGPLGGVKQNILLHDDSFFGLLAGGVVVPPILPAAPIVPESHDNIDQFDSQMLDTNEDRINDDWMYFTLYPDEAFVAGLSPADILDVAPGGSTTSGTPFAMSWMMGLREEGDSIDGLIMFDRGEKGGEEWGGPGAEPERDFALFSLSPDSVSLAMWGLRHGDVLFTDFTNKFFLYSPDRWLGLQPEDIEFPDNVDALEFSPRGHCLPDIDASGDVGFNDLVRLLSNWGPCGVIPEDLDGDHIVGFQDLIVLLSYWGPC